MKERIIFTSIVLVCFIVLSTGCVDFLPNGVTYNSHPTKISYKISYGYYVECKGDGDFEINYDCDIPETLSGIVSYSIINETYNHNILDLVGNEMIRWNISDSGYKKYTLGVEAEVQAQSFIIQDLNGDDALTIDEIENNFPEIFNQYCNAQFNDGIVYVEPNNPDIKSIAEDVLLESESNNAFIVAKELFIWLKENTVYEDHKTDQDVQTASKTFEDKAGDCDDLSVLYISLCRSIKIPARFIRGILTVYDKSDSSVSSIPHAWTEVFVGGNIGDNGWIPVECAGTTTSVNKIQVEVNQNFGVESAGHLRLFKGTGTNESLKVSSSGPSASYYDNVITMDAFLQVEDYIPIQENSLHINDDGYRTYK